MALSHSDSVETASQEALNPKILSLLGDDVTLEQRSDPPIHSDVAARWVHVFHKGLEAEKRRGLLLKYPPPENSVAFKAPHLNPVVKHAILESVSKRDDRLVQKQMQLGAGLTAIGSVISDLLKQEGGWQ